MKILIYKDLILGLINQDLGNNNHQKQIKKILNNENSSFFYSKKFLTYIETEVSEENHDLFKNLVKLLVDERGSNIPSSPISQNFDEEILHIYSNIQERVIVKLSYNLPNALITNNISNFAALSLIQRPNFHWLVINLAILHPNVIRLRCFEFINNSQIDQLFKDIFSIPKTISLINIFDVYCNFDHNKFDFITQSSRRVNYYTKYDRHIQDRLDRRDDIKDFFGRSARVFLLKRGNRAHARMVIFEGLIITPNEDFWNLEVNGSDWNIDIEYSEEIANNWLNSRCNRYMQSR